MSLNNLIETTKKSKKRIGRGHGSGKGGHTVGKGKYGQKSRKGKIPLLFEGTKTKKSLLKRLPLLRGKGKFKSLKPKPIIINLKYLNLFKTGELVNLETLTKKGLIRKQEFFQRVKILGEGDIKIPLTVQLPISKGAREKIEKAGGKVDFSESRQNQSRKNPSVQKSAPKTIKKTVKDEKN